MKILLVDNAEDVRNLITSQLEKWGHQVAVANNGDEARRMVRKHKIQLVISDWMRSETEGLKLCYELCSSELEHYVYFIVLSDKTQNQYVAEGLSAGADDFIYQPFNCKILKSKISSAKKVIKMKNQLTQKNRSLKQAHEVIKKMQLQM